METPWQLRSITWTMAALFNSFWTSTWTRVKLSAISREFFPSYPHLIVTQDSLLKKRRNYWNSSGTGYEVWGNCNAPRAITLSALIYCLRCIVGRDVPLNQVTLIFSHPFLCYSSNEEHTTVVKCSTGLSEACQGDNSKRIATGSFGGGSGGRWQRPHVAARGWRGSASFRSLCSVARVHEQRDARHRGVGLLRDCRRGQRSRKRFNFPTLFVSRHFDSMIISGKRVRPGTAGVECTLTWRTRESPTPRYWNFVTRSFSISFLFEAEAVETVPIEEAMASSARRRSGKNWKLKFVARNLRRFPLFAERLWRCPCWRKEGWTARLDWPGEDRVEKEGTRW